MRPAACGGVYKAVAELSDHNDQCEMVTIPVAPGVTICRKRTVELAWQEPDTGVAVARFRGPDASSAPLQMAEELPAASDRPPFGNRVKATLCPLAAGVLGEERLRRTLARMRGSARS